MDLSLNIACAPCRGPARHREFSTAGGAARGQMRARRTQTAGEEKFQGRYRAKTVSLVLKAGPQADRAGIPTGQA
jgi:hypothetical protein